MDHVYLAITTLLKYARIVDNTSPDPQDSAPDFSVEYYCNCKVHGGLETSSLDKLQILSSNKVDVTSLLVAAATSAAQIQCRNHPQHYVAQLVFPLC